MTKTLDLMAGLKKHRLPPFRAQRLCHARRVGAIDVLPLIEFLTRLWSDAYAA